jgi:hypothetical protein
MLNGGMAPQIFNLSIKWKCVVNIILQSFNGEHSVLPVEHIKNKTSFLYKKQPLINKGQSGCIFYIFAGRVVPRERFLHSHWIEGCVSPYRQSGSWKDEENLLPLLRAELSQCVVYMVVST